jgi:hypothetical protein
LHLHRPQLAEIESAKVLERVVFEGPSVSRVGVSIDDGCLYPQPVASELRHPLARRLAELLIELVS